MADNKSSRNQGVAEGQIDLDGKKTYLVDMSKPMSPAAKLYQEAFTKAAREAAARAELAGVEPVGVPNEPQHKFQSLGLASLETGATLRAFAEALEAVDADFEVDIKGSDFVDVAPRRR